jgi:cupin 2 domain-containing protein
MSKISFLDNIPVDKKNEKFFKILDQKGVRIEKIVSNGQKSPENFWYDQEENEFVMVLKGHAIVEFEDREVELKEGDAYNIDAHVKHRVKYTHKSQPTVWLAVFY